MPTEKEVLHGFLSKTLNMDNDGVTSLYNEDGSELKPEALQLLFERDQQRITALKPDTKKIQDDWYKKGQSESLKAYEKNLADSLGFKTDKKGDEFLEELKAHLTKDGPDDPDKIKKSKIYIDAVENHNKLLLETETKYKTELENYQKQVERKELFQIVVNDALTQFEAMKPILPQDTAKAANLKKIFINELDSVDYVVRDGKKVLLNKDGTDKQDGHGNRVTFEAFVKETAEKYFEFYKADQKAAPPGPNGNNNQKPTVFIINSAEDFQKYLKEVKTPEEKALLLTAFNEAKAAGRVK